MAWKQRIANGIQQDNFTMTRSDDRGGERNDERRMAGTDEALHINQIGSRSVVLNFGDHEKVWLEVNQQVKTGPWD